MPQEQNRDFLAEKLRQNWISKFPETRPAAVKEVDDSLTNLNWLQSINLSANLSTAPPLSPPPHDLTNGGPLYRRAVSCGPPMPQLIPSPPEPIEALLTESQRLDYSTNPIAKPNFAYAVLIGMAMRDLKKAKVSLTDLYDWIMDNFMYYRVADPSWQNSVRHNLSLNKCFQKVPRRKDERGKGGLWRFNPEYFRMVDSEPPATVANQNVTGAKRRKTTTTPLSGVKRQRNMRGGMHRSASGPGELNAGHLGTALPSFNFMPWLDGGRHIFQYGNDFPHGTLPAMSLPSLTAADGNGADMQSSIVDPDAFIEDFLKGGDDKFPPAVDQTTDGDPLDLTIQGQRIKPPDWWNQSLGSSGGAAKLIGLDSSFVGRNATAPSPLLLEEDQQWVDEHLNLEDLDSLLGLN